MNIFVLGWANGDDADIAAAGTALQRLLRALPFGLGPIATWLGPDRRVVAAWASHAPEVVGGVSYAHAEADALALFTGRPITWAGDRADGREPLDPRYYLGPAAGWAPSLDGRAAAASAAAGRLEVWSDPLGSYPLYVLEASGVSWISNNAEVLCHMGGSREMDRAGLAALVGGGWPLDGHPIWSRVRRLPPGLHTFGTEAPRPEPSPATGGALDADAAAETLVEALRALADWPGRPNVVPVTGGRDSHVVLAAARAAGLDFTTVTGGAAIEPDPSGDMWSRPRRAARTLMFMSAGTASLADAARFPLSPRQGPLPLWHTGQGGGLARACYPARRGRARAVRAIERAYTGRRAGRRPPLNARGSELVRRQIDAWADQQLDAGARPRDLADLFYLTRRMGTWAGPTHGAVEWVRDSTSVLWSRRLVPHLVALSRRERQAERLHREVLALLAPELLDVPPAGDAPGQGDGEEADAFSAVRDVVATAAASSENHPVFDVLDRESVEQLLGSASADTTRRHYVWRLATVLLADGE